jgi:hypothetical protein
LINDHINDAYQEFAMLTGVLEIRQVVTSIAGQAEYLMPVTVSRIFRLSFSDYALAVTSQRELDEQDPSHRIRLGQPEAFTKDRLNQWIIRLYPIPATGGIGTVFDEEYGEIIDITGGDTFSFDNELGCVVNIANSQFNQELGIVIGADIRGAGDIEAWAKKAPNRLVHDNQVPELPSYVHLGLAYAAAARVLQARTEIRNMDLSAAYETLAQDYVRFLSRIANNRTPERVQRAGTADHVRAFRLTRDTEIPVP